MWAVLAAAVAGGIAPMLLTPVPASASASASAGDPRLAEMASPSPFRGLDYTGLSLGRKGSTCDGAFEATSRTGVSLGCSHGPDPAPPGTDVRRGRSDQQVAADARPVPALAGTRTADDVRTAAASQGSVGCIGDGVTG